MNRSNADKRVAIAITPREAYEFLNKLAYDDSFRAKFESDPQAIFDEIHVYLPDGVIPEKTTLPPKADFQRALSSAAIEKESPVALSPAFVFIAFFAFFKK